MGEPMKLICEYPPGNLRNVTTANNITSVATAVKNMPGVGQPFLIFQSLPGQVVLVDFGRYPDYIVSSDVAQNAALIQQMLDASPIDALTFAE